MYNRHAADERQPPVEDGQSKGRQAEEALFALFHKNERGDEPAKTPAPVDPSASMRAKSFSVNQFNDAFRSISLAPTAPSVGEASVQSAEEYKKLVLADDDVKYLKENIAEVFLLMKVDAIPMDTLVDLVSHRVKEVCKIFDIPFYFKNSPYLRKLCIMYLALFFPQEFSYDPYSKQLSTSTKVKKNANSKRKVKADVDRAPQPEMLVFLPPPGISVSVVRAPVASSNVPPLGIDAPSGLTTRRNDSSTAEAATTQKDAFSSGRLAFQ